MCRPRLTPGTAERKFRQGALLIGLVVVAYLPMWHAGFVWDDDHMLTENPLIRDGNGLFQFWFTRNAADYWPVTSTTLWVEWRLWGMQPLGYHVTNLVLHLASVLLLWSILRRLRVPGAWVGAAIFAVHPLNVESVTWIAERKNGLAMLFYLLSILAWLKLPDPTERTAEEARRRNDWDHWYWISFIAFILGMLSKGSVATLPLVLVGLIAWRRRPTLPEWLRLLPFFVGAIGLTALNVWFQRHGYPEAIRSAGIGERMLGAGAVVWFYLGKALWPIGLRFVYPLWHIRLSDWSWWMPSLFVVAFTALLAVWALRERRDEGIAAWRRGTLFAWCYFCVSLVPVLGLVDVYFMKYSLVADHYAHIALIGIAAWVGFAVETVYERVLGAKRIGLLAAGVAGISVLVGLTWRQNRMYRNNVTLARTLLAADPASWMGHILLATELAKIPDDSVEAASEFEAALKLRPDYAPAHNDLALQLELIPGRTADAAGEFAQALRVDPRFAAAHSNLGNLLARDPEQLPPAIEHYEAALRISPNDAETHNDLGVALGKTAGRAHEAIREFTEAIRLNPNDADFYYNLGNLLAKQPDGLARAEQQYELAVRLRPTFSAAHFNLAVVCEAQGKSAAARLHFQRVLEIEPGNVSARARLERLAAP